MSLGCPCAQHILCFPIPNTTNLLRCLLSCWHCRQVLPRQPVPYRWERLGLGQNCVHRVPCIRLGDHGPAYNFGQAPTALPDPSTCASASACRLLPASPFLTCPAPTLHTMSHMRSQALSAAASTLPHKSWSKGLLRN